MYHLFILNQPIKSLFTSAFRGNQPLFEDVMWTAFKFFDYSSGLKSSHRCYIL